MTLLLGLLVGFIPAYLIGYRIRCRIAQRQLEQQIPAWVNQGNRAVIGTYDEILEAIWQEANFQLWELEMGDR